MISKFFIDRPVFAWVIAILIMISGVFSIQYLPIEQYPNIAPPSVSVRTSYPGASAKIVENSVTQVIEQRLVGIDNLRYFKSTSDSEGNAVINLTFESGTDPDVAQIQTQNKVQTALSILPDAVQKQGIIVTKSNDPFLLVAGFYSKTGKTSEREIGDILVSKIEDNIARINGVGDITVFGFPNAMRIWLDPEKLTFYKFNVSEVTNAILATNIDLSSGQLSGLPSIKGQQLNVNIISKSLLKTPEEFGNIILRSNIDGGKILLKDVAKIEIGSESYDDIVRYKGLPAAGIGVSLASGANALKTAKIVKEKISELKLLFPEDVELIYPYDTTPFIKLSIKEVVKTLIEGIILVFLVIYLFLQNFRATIIPTITIPIVILGSFTILAIFGFSINLLTMFAMVLSIGLLVDDAIIVVENVERLMKEENLSARDATRKSMDQITNALIGVTMVLSAIFLPMAFFPGSAGMIYRQFSITIVSSMAISVAVALILSPSLCATILKTSEDQADTNIFFEKFDQKFNSLKSFYHNFVKKILEESKKFFILYIVIIITLIFGFYKIPKSFLPDEDQGVMYFMVNNPPGTSLETSLETIKIVENYLLSEEKDNIEHLFSTTGYSVMGRSQNVGFGFIGLKDWEKRPKASQSVKSIAGRAMRNLSKIKDSSIFFFFPPPIRELGTASGFDVEIIDVKSLGHEKLMKARNEILRNAAMNQKLSSVRPNGLSDVPELVINLDAEKIGLFQLNQNDVNNTVEIAWAGSYICDFVDQNRIKKVFLQSKPEYRMAEKDIKYWHVRNKNNEMVPFANFSTEKWQYGSPRLERFNGNPAINILGAPNFQVSSGVAMEEIAKIIESLPEKFAYGWSGLSYEENLAGSQTILLYITSLLVIFLSLAALYESWSIPFSVMMIVPLGVFGAIIASLLCGLNNDIYFQVGVLTTIGLAAKNAILIIEFAKELNLVGHNFTDAILIACKQRFRPIIMTSSAFILGVLPLALAKGAGSASQNAIGITVVGGTISATCLAIFFVPLFYVYIQKRFSNKIILGS